MRNNVYTYIITLFQKKSSTLHKIYKFCECFINTLVTHYTKTQYIITVFFKFLIENFFAITKRADNKPALL